MGAHRSSGSTIAPGWLPEDQERFFSISLDLLCLAGFDGYFKSLNPAWERVLGFTIDELLTEPFLSFVHPEDRGRTAAETAKLMTGEQTVRFDNRYRHRDGSYRWLEWTATPDLDRNLIYASARDVTEQIRLEAELRDATAQSKRANQAKSEFVSRMSHELRTPLNAILGFAQLLQLDGLNPEQSDSVDQILTAGHHLLDLINEVLDLAKIESGHLSYSLEPVELDEVMREACDLIQPLATDGGIELRHQPLDRPSVYVRADRRRLAQVLLNLMANAVKFNRDGGSVTLAARETGLDRIRVSVSDTGMGIPAERIDQVFEPFVRIDDHDEIEGTGLGLALVKGFVEAMGSEIHVESEHGTGTTFSFDLPLEAAPDELLELVDLDQDPGTQGSGARTILYVEDNLANLRLIERVLARREDVKLISTMLGNMAVDLAIQHLPDLILLDLDLPDVPGDDVLRRLQAEVDTRNIPVIVVSADASPTHAKRLLATGAADYLTKPIDVRRFLRVLDRNLDGNEGDAGD